MSDKVIVTGAAGFIGFHLSKSMLRDGYQVLGVDNLNDYYDPALKMARLDILRKFNNFKFEKIDISHRDELTVAFTEFKPHKVVNLAAQAGVRYSLTNPYAYLDSNLTGFLNILELCRHNNVEGLIYASSSSVYGANKKIPFSVEDRVDHPISLYAATKKANELIAHSYSHLYGLHTTGLRFFTVYGPWGRPDMAIFIFTKKILNDQPIDLYNHGKMKRDFTYIDDIVTGIRRSIDKNYRSEIFNIGNHRSEELENVVKLLENHLGREALTNLCPMQPGDVPESFADISKTRELLGYEPTTNIGEGIPKFVDWYKLYHQIS